MADVHHIYKDHECVKFLLGKRDGILLSYNSYLYKRINGKFPKTVWKCTKGCNASVHTNNGLFDKAKFTESHSHPPQIDEIVKLQTMMAMKMRVKCEFNLSPREIHR